jgi:ABC-type transport system involved in cytochrome c biogenesis permease subunit
VSPVLGLHAAALAALVPAAAATARPPRPEGLAALLVTCAGAAALGLQSTGLALWWWQVGHGPWLDRFELFSANALLLQVGFLAARRRAPVLTAAAGPVAWLAVLLLGAAIWMGPAARPLPVIMDSPWLVAHALAFEGASVAVALALGLALALLRPGAEGGADHELLDHLQYRWAGLALALWTAGMVLGSTWGYHTFGVFWSWDPVEVWSLAAWMALGAALHLRRLFTLAPRRHARLFLVVAALLLFALYVAPLLRGSMHPTAGR